MTNYFGLNAESRSIYSEEKVEVLAYLFISSKRREDGAFSDIFLPILDMHVYALDFQRRSSSND